MTTATQTTKTQKLNGKKVGLLAALLVILAAAAILLTGAFGSWTTSESQTQVVTGAIVDLCGPNDTCETTFNNTVAGMLPGDSGVRAITLANSGDVDISAASLTVTTSNAQLDDDLQVTIERCDGTYTAPLSATAAPTCSTAWQTVRTNVAVKDVGEVTLLAGALPHTTNNTKGFKFTYTLDALAPNTTTGADVNLTYEIVGQQRAPVTPAS